MSYPRYVNLGSMPSPKKEYVQNFPMLTGGLNIFELDYRLDPNESPEMENLMWREGALNCRDGQVWLTEAELGNGICTYERFFKGYIFAHIGVKLYCFDPTAEEVEGVELYSGLPEIRGSFFLYNDKLYYKTRGKYIEIVYTPDGTDPFEADDVAGYVPVTVINAVPYNGSGDLYQPENRISSAKTMWYNAEEDITAYKLPVVDIDDVDEVTVDGVLLTEDTDYTVDKVNGVVNFVTAPPVTDPPTNNTVHITYSKANPDAMNSIMDCVYAVPYGGTGALCVAMAGSLAQPNAYFWNGNNIIMDATYFPMNQYQLAGSADDAITGFGKQQSYLVVFQTNSVGRTILKTETIDDRVTIDLPYTAINDKAGCDLPWSIQLIENNLVWCNTYQGVHLLKDSSAAYENNIVCVSLKVNGSTIKAGLLEDVRKAGVVCSFDDDHRYWLCANGHAWVWDYELSDYKKPSWFYWTGINPVSFVLDQSDVYHLNAVGRLTHMERVYADYAGPIKKVYRFATQYFGTYDVLKNVNSVIIVSRSDTNAETTLTYITDYETREDLTKLQALIWSLVPRNLTFRSLRGLGFAEVFRRKPMCRRVRHFTMKLENNELGEDLSVVSAQIFYTFQGRQR